MDRGEELKARTSSGVMAKEEEENEGSTWSTWTKGKESRPQSVNSGREGNENPGPNTNSLGYALVL